MDKLVGNARHSKVVFFKTSLSVLWHFFKNTFVLEIASQPSQTNQYLARKFTLNLAGVVEVLFTTFTSLLYRDLQTQTNGECLYSRYSTDMNVVNNILNNSIIVRKHYIWKISNRSIENCYKVKRKLGPQWGKNLNWPWSIMWTQQENVESLMQKISFIFSLTI